MKKIVTILAVALLATTSVMAQDVKIKKGKVTMTEAQYNELKGKAEQFEIVAQKLTNAQMQLRKQDAPVRLDNFKDSASYAIGKDIFDNWKRQKLDLNFRVVARSIEDCALGRNKWNPKDSEPVLRKFQANFEARQRGIVQNNIKAGEEFLKKNMNNKSVYTTKSGLQYIKVKEGKGKKPTATSMVKAHYTGKLLDGTVFDSSKQRGEPLEFRVNQMIPGWIEGLQLMPEGSTYRFFIPHHLAYGEREAGIIPGGSTLIFEVELIEVK